MNRLNDSIAVFDSGVGGLSVLRCLRRELPGERFLYFGDSANAPYGTRPTQEIRDLTFAAAEYLAAKGIKALVVACNTATSAAICQLRSAYPSLIVIGIEPALKPAADAFPGGRIGVMATPLTLREEKFRELVAHYKKSCTVLPIPAPGLVELVEAGKGDSPEADALLRELFSPPERQDLDALVLGCTHFPFVEKSLRRVLGGQVRLFDGGPGTARETRRRLECAGLLENGAGSLVIENSSGKPAMLELSRKLLEE